MAEHDGARLENQGSPAPPNDYGGSSNLGLATGAVVDLLFAVTGDEFQSKDPRLSLGTVTGFTLALSGDEWAAVPFIFEHGTVLERFSPLSGTTFDGRALRLDKVYRSADRITYVGYALDQSGQPLRQYQLQFIGETVEENFSGTATDLNGIFVAYLTVGDTYTAYAFDPRAGFVYELVSITTKPNSVDLIFKLKTKRGGFGEGVFLGSY